MEKKMISIASLKMAEIIGIEEDVYEAIIDKFNHKSFGFKEDELYKELGFKTMKHSDTICYSTYDLVRRL